MAEVDPWLAYFYPETLNERRQGTLRNNYGVRDAEVLRQIEYGKTAQRALELRTGAVSIPRTYDEAHVRALHGHLFQDVYPWAGQFRTVDMAKGPKGFFANAEGGARDIPDALAQVSRSVRDVDWQRADRAQFAQGMATTFSWLNHAHPFREGNGRATKEFLHEVAEQSPRYALDFARVSPMLWNRDSDRSLPAPGEGTPHPENIRMVFDSLTVDRPDGDRGADLSGPTRSPLLDVSYPGRATEATRQPPAAGKEPASGRLSRWLHRDHGKGGQER